VPSDTPTPRSIVERLALRGIAFMLFPVVLLSVLGFAVASLPAAALRRPER
jgi:hypothetical protein